MLPDMNGYAVCEEHPPHRTRSIPIIMLTARSQETDKIRGLDAGADDYVTKPFSVNELIARIRAIFRRGGARSAPCRRRSRSATSQVNFDAHTVNVRGADAQLSFYEVELLRLLAERVGQPVARDEILRRFGASRRAPTNRTVDNFIVKLRKKIEKRPDKPAAHPHGVRLRLQARARVGGIMRHRLPKVVFLVILRSEATKDPGAAGCPRPATRGSFASLRMTIHAPGHRAVRGRRTSAK